MRTRAALRLTVHTLALGLVIAPGARAQRASDAQLAVGGTSARTADPDSSTRLSTGLNHGRAIGGGLALGLVGAVGGSLVGAATASGCKGEYCALGPVALGLAIGESVGVALGTHLGSGGHGGVGTAMLVSTAIGITGVFAAAASGGIALPLVPVVQIATVLAMER
jgi:hypothetical protein